MDACGRRDFLRMMGAGGAACLLNGAGVLSLFGDAPDELLRAATDWERLPDGRVRCNICPFDWSLAEGQTCICRARLNRKGTLYTTAYENPCIVKQVPVEQGPFHHFLPGAQSLSIGLAGCNLRCQYCQNWEVSQKGPEETMNVTLGAPETLKEANRLRCDVVTFTYTEPMVYLEYIETVAERAREKGSRVAICSALYVRKEPLKRLAKKVDAFCGTLKGFNETFYANVCGGKLAPVLEALTTIRESGKWLEVAVLVVPTMNDNRAEVRSLCDWVVKNLGGDTPLHFLRFTPSWKLADLPATPPAVLDDCRKIAQDAGVRHAYIGNLPGHEGANTFCPSCKRVQIRRLGFRVSENKMKGNKCGQCGTAIAGVWKKA